MLLGKPEEGLLFRCEKRGQRCYSSCTTELQSGASSTLPGTGNEVKKPTSLLKDFTTELYSRQGWGLLPPNEAGPQHRRAFKAHMARKKLRGS